MTQRFVRSLLIACGAALIVASAATQASAQSAYPIRPVKFIVPFAAGGGIDLTARMSAEKMGEALGQQIVIENQGGAGGALGTQFVVKAEPDGYTLLYHSTTGTVHSAVTEKLQYDWLNDLVPVATITRFAPVMVVSNELPAKDIKEFIALLKANPGKYSFGSSGAGSAIHLAAELFLQKAGVQMIHVPYRGTGAVMPDLLAGRIAMMVDGVPPQAKNIQNGVLRGMAVTTATRSPALPDVPTMKESGLDFEVPFWTAIYAPKNTPKAVVDRIAAAARTAMQDQGVIAKLAEIGTESVGTGPAELDKVNREQYRLYRDLVQNNKALLEGK